MAMASFADVALNSQSARYFHKVATPTMVAGRWQSLFYLAGRPAAAVAPSPGIAGAVLTTYAGQLPYTNAAGGLVTRLAKFQANLPSTGAGILLLCDRLWHNSGLDLTLTTEQLFTGSAQIPARDRNGANAGDGVYAGLEISTITGAGVPTLTLKYTNQAGTAGQIATSVIPGVAASAVGSFYDFGLAASDIGIQKAQSLQLNATWTSGVAHLVLYRIIAALELNGAPNALDALTGGLPYMFDNTVPFLIYCPSATTALNMSGQAVWTQG